MGRRIVKALVVGPSCSAAINDADAPLTGNIRALAVEHGVTLFLTAISCQAVSALKRWFDNVDDERLRANVRLLTPGRFRWSHGEIRMPSKTKRPREALQTAVPLIEKVLKAAGVDAQVAYDDADESILLIGPQQLAADVRHNIWLACNTPEFDFGVDLSSDLETEQQPDGSWAAVLGPDRASEVWFDALTRVERFDPTNVAILEAPAQVGAVLSALNVRLREARLLLDRDRSEATQEAGDAIYEAFPEDVAFAARISAPSDIHFIQAWSKANREFVRHGYWQATKTAQVNLARGKELLRDLDPKIYGRAHDLADMADRSEGDRLVDDFSGAVCFAPGFYEFEAPLPTGVAAVDAMVFELRTYFDKKLDEMPFDRPLLRRRLFSNSLVLMRGEGYYANLKQTPPWDRAGDYVVEAQALARLCRKLLESPAHIDLAFKRCLESNQKTLTAWKLLVATMDQARNLGLIMLSVAMHLWRDSGKTWKESKLILDATELVRLHYAAMLGDCRSNGSDVFRIVRDAADHAAAELKYLQTTEAERAGSSDWYEPSRPIRGWREADNPFENILLGLLAADSLEPQASPASALGLFWGGVELPISTKLAADALGRSVDAYGFISIGRYSGAATKDDQFYCDLSTGDFLDFDALLRKRPSKVLLLDDNALSGQTLESARDSLMTHGAKTIDTWVVRFSGERREGQMRMANSGIVHPAYADGNLKGSLGETPYARSYSRKHYESPVGVFNVARARVLRYLHSNGFASIFEREGF